MVTILPPHVAASLRAAELTYPAVGATGEGTTPPGHHSFQRTRLLQRRDFDAAGRELLGWQVQEYAGVRVAASAPRAEAGAVVLMRLGIGPLAVRIPCRVISVVEEPDRVGFAYGTLPGHPESGEERFVLERCDDGRLRFTVSAFSRPATLLARAGGPLTTWTQRWMTARYLRALDALPPSAAR
ncbi:DUF1990 domain-containing protein [Nocardioides sp. BP30]|uniref:DUF1990 family protein n=1 Tax=Nocardioides sp. BP30 TaxID=3036374 RepID=UPI002468DE8B|nr:DUF1990 domain-containing protein [Nocardioides sp. BP30]WGL51647.1 DUF1990 domain-containing protein [Nocardioides sp. BP30]